MYDRFKIPSSESEVYGLDVLSGGMLRIPGMHCRAVQSIIIYIHLAIGNITAGLVHGQFPYKITRKNVSFFIFFAKIF